MYYCTFRVDPTAYDLDKSVQSTQICLMSIYEVDCSSTYKIGSRNYTGQHVYIMLRGVMSWF